MRRHVPIFILLLCQIGCSTYTLAPISSTEAGSTFVAGRTYRVAPANAVLVRSWSTGALGESRPAIELTRYPCPEFGKVVIHDVPAGTLVNIENYVRFDQHGWYDGGFNGWKFAIASIQSGKLNGTRCLIDASHLGNTDPAESLLDRD